MSSKALTTTSSPSHLRFVLPAAGLIVWACQPHTSHSEHKWIIEDSVLIKHKNLSMHDLRAPFVDTHL